MTHTAAAVQQQDQEPDQEFDPVTGCYHHPDSNAVIPRSVFLSPALISWCCGFVAPSEAPLTAQILSTLYGSEQGWSKAALISVMGGTERIWRRYLHNLQSLGLVTKTKAGIGHASCWSLTPRAADELRQSYPSGPPKILGNVLLNLQRLHPNAHLDSLVIKAQVLTRCWRSDQLVYNASTNLVISSDYCTSPDPKAYEGCPDLPEVVYHPTPSNLIEEALPGLPRQTVHRAIAGLGAAGLLARRIEAMDGGRSCYLATTAGWRVGSDAPDRSAAVTKGRTETSNACLPNVRSAVTETSDPCHGNVQAVSRKRPMAVTETSNLYKGQDKGLDKELDKAHVASDLAPQGGEAFGQTQNQNQQETALMESPALLIGSADAAMPHPPTPLPAPPAAAAPPAPAFVADWSQWDLQPGQKPSRWHNADGSPIQPAAAQDTSQALTGPSQVEIEQLFNPEINLHLGGLIQQHLKPGFTIWLDGAGRVQSAPSKPSSGRNRPDC